MLESFKKFNITVRNQIYGLIFHSTILKNMKKLNYFRYWKFLMRNVIPWGNISPTLFYRSWKRKSPKMRKISYYRNVPSLIFLKAISKPFFEYLYVSSLHIFSSLWSLFVDVNFLLEPWQAISMWIMPCVFLAWTLSTTKSSY